MIRGRDELQAAYRNETVAREYVRRRFQSPLGALLHSRQIRVVRQVIRDHQISRALEIAPGPARLTVDVAPLLESVTLVDASAQMLQEASQRLREHAVTTRAHLVQGDAFNLPLRERFDLAYTFRLIRHFEHADRLRLYQSIRSILRPGGQLVFDAVNEHVSAPLRARAAPGDHEHFDALLRPESLQEELATAGFDRVTLVGVQHRFSAQMKCQIYLAPRSARLARATMEAFERLGGEPLEWVVTCRRV